MKISKEKKINDYTAFQQLFGGLDTNVRLLEEEFGVSVFTGAESLRITGEKGDVESAAEAKTLSYRCRARSRWGRSRSRRWRTW